MNWQFRYLLTQQMFATGLSELIPNFIALHVLTYACVRMQMRDPLISSFVSHPFFVTSSACSLPDSRQIWVLFVFFSFRAITSDVPCFHVLVLSSFIICGHIICWQWRMNPNICIAFVTVNIIKMKLVSSLNNQKKTLRETSVCEMRWNQFRNFKWLRAFALNTLNE